jgi:hypothetical protein
MKKKSQHTAGIVPALLMRKDFILPSETYPAAAQKAS